MIRARGGGAAGGVGGGVGDGVGGGEGGGVCCVRLTQSTPRLHIVGSLVRVRVGLGSGLGVGRHTST